MPDLLTASESAARIGVDVTTFNRWVTKDGKIKPALAFPGYRGARLFRPADVERLARARAKAAAKRVAS